MTDAISFAEVMLSAGSATLAAGVPVYLAVRKQRSEDIADRAELGERITKLESGHEYAFDHLAAAMAQNARALEKLDDKLDALSITVAKSGAYEKRN